jgi:nucleoside phosphorylase
MPATAKVLQNTEPLHPARLLVSAAVSASDFSKRFLPSINNTPDLPAVDWAAVAQQAPQLLNTPSQLPRADAVVVTWAAAEWAAMEHVFCSNTTTMPYTKRNEESWNGWVKYSQGAPNGLGYWGYYRLVQVGPTKVLLFKSNTHYASSQGEQNLEELTNHFIQTVKPTLILSIGTSGGARNTDPVGTVNVVHTDVLYESNQPQNVWPSYSNKWKPNWALLGDESFNHLLFPVPTTADDLRSIAEQFNAFYSTNYPLSELNPNNLNMGASVPAINNLTSTGTPLLTAKSFVVANTSGNLANFACVEMDDAIIAKTAASAKTAFGSLRNISDPIQNSALSESFQGHWGEAIYTAYGMYTSYNGAIAAWAVLS